MEQEPYVSREAWNDYDLFFIHYKYSDAAVEDGNFDLKVKRIEELDTAILQIEALRPTVFMVTGDHSTPSKLRRHSWHAVPIVLAGGACRTDECTTFSERAALRGGLGQFEAKYLMPLALAHAGRLGKYGA